MHYGEILIADCANGVGIRVSLFVSGCTNHCKGCFQPQTWDFNYNYMLQNSFKKLLMHFLFFLYISSIPITSNGLNIVRESFQNIFRTAFFQIQ